METLTAGEILESKKLIETKLTEVRSALREITNQSNEDDKIKNVLFLCESEKQLEIILIKMSLVPDKVDNKNNTLTTSKNSTIKIEKNIPNRYVCSVKERPKLNIELEEKFILFINTYCDFVEGKSIKASLFCDKYNEINGTNLTLVRVGLTLKQLFNILPIKKITKNDGTYYLGIIFK